MTRTPTRTPANALALLGAGGHGKVVADAALAAGWASVAFFDDAWSRLPRHGRWPVAGGSAQLTARLAEFDGVVVAIGNAQTRLRKQRELGAAGARLVAIVHPRAIVSTFAQVGAGSVVMAGAVINADTQVGEACIVNTGAVLDHDCRLAEGVHVSGNACLCGGVHVGARSWIGAGATVRDGVRIGADVTVGLGAAVVKSVPDGVTVVGCPAAPLKSHSS